MSFFYSAIRRQLWSLTFFLGVLTQNIAQNPFFQSWQQSWWFNRKSILVLTVINTTLTAGTEYVSRTLAQPLHNYDPAYDFFVKTESGFYSIHRQSLTNIWMTLFASLIGGPVFFFVRRRNRFLFFVSFGIFNSFLGQMMSGIMREGYLNLQAPRLIFDLFYNGTFKFMVFEVLRRPIIKTRRNVLGLGVIRSIQDFFTTFIKVFFLNSFGFKG